MAQKKATDHTVSEISNYLITTNLMRVFSDFLTDREVRGARPATLTYYHNEITIFTKWAAGVGAQELQDLTPDVLRAYFLALRERRKVKGIYQNYTAVKTWLLWAWEEFEQPGQCPIQRVQVQKPDNKPKPGVSLESANLLVEACTGRNGKRDYAILLTLIDTGIRRQECCVLTLGQLDGDTLRLAPDGTKTGEARPAFISLTTQKALRAYLQERGRLGKDAPLFATEKGGPLTVNGLRQIVRRRCEQAGLKELGLHGFRRLFALETWRATHDLEGVSRLLGHKYTSTTRRYLNLQEDDLREVHRKSSPVDKLKKKRK